MCLFWCAVGTVACSGLCLVQTNICYTTYCTPFTARLHSVKLLGSQHQFGRAAWSITMHVQPQIAHPSAKHTICSNAETTNSLYIELLWLSRVWLCSGILVCSCIESINVLVLVCCWDCCMLQVVFGSTKQFVTQPFVLLSQHNTPKEYVGLVQQPNVT
ncbi:hypothetical protein COO60DRAFT_119744 [Scenedesmus sp. NREL 46B-D3]|nr:hypothetical protein COO60DRAFT_119744 [Scenedesmus sp. NREL 46B-D3]